MRSSLPSVSWVKVSPFVITNVHPSLISPFDLVDIPAGVKRIVDAVKADPVNLGSKSFYVLFCAFHLPFTYTFFHFQA